MTRNIGSLDQAIRLIFALILITSPFVSGLSYFDTTWMTYTSVSLGVVMLLVSLIRICPLYSILGIRTCKSC
ncbi:hypothetical protein WH96_19165 [Kiloniella spongiae]|uniref:Inner membrane protein YgaP-like transmembrane domain-containing protein n=1 Tax=Kiloniella spongiae TaxID=1489064 RepID=A0A0H2M9B4_9PROT|nr:DUF2892 domain-containing protein [Kiloniella spongiae]KLN59104.1 hypothetical protein WH96_19165 [Kiloniella spongiae]